jgi:hypothetical protein
VTVLREDFEVRSATGALIYTSPERKLALRWARVNGATFPGLKVEWVIVTEARRRVWTERASQVERAA